MKVILPFPINFFVRGRGDSELIFHVICSVYHIVISISNMHKFLRMSQSWCSMFKIMKEKMLTKVSSLFQFIYSQSILNIIVYKTAPRSIYLALKLTSSSCSSKIKGGNGICAASMKTIYVKNITTFF